MYFYNLFENNEELQGNNIIIIGDFNLPYIVDSSYNLQTGVPSYRALDIFLSLYDLHSVNNIKIKTIET